MKDYTDRAFYLDKAALGLLLDSKGVGSLKCLDIFGETAEIDDSSAVKSLYDMVKDGIVNVGSEDFYLADDVDSIISSLIDAKSALVIYTADSNAPNMVFYKSEKGIIATEQDANRRCSLKLYKTDNDELSRIIEEEFAPDISETVKPENSFEDTAGDLYLSSLSLLNLRDDLNGVISSERALLLLQIIDLSDDEPVAKAAVVRHGLGLSMIIWRNDRVIKIPYSKDSLHQLINDRFIEEKK